MTKMEGWKKQKKQKKQKTMNSIIYNVIVP